MSAGLSETKNVFARKIQKLTTRSRSSSNTPQADLMPPSPTDYFTQPDESTIPPSRSRSRSAASAGPIAPLTPVTPTGFAGGVSVSTLVQPEVPTTTRPPSPERGRLATPRNTCPYCKLSSLPTINGSRCCCNKPVEDSEHLDESEAIADKMAQKILHQVGSQSEQGWTI